MVSLRKRIKTRRTASLPKAKGIALLGIGSLLLLFFAALGTRRHDETLLDGLSDTEKATIVRALAESGGFDPRTDRPGAIELPREQIPAARMRLAMAGKLQTTGNRGWMAQPSQGGDASLDSNEDVLNAAREKEIVRMLETVKGVESARVLITRPEERMFPESNAHPTASITLVEKGSDLSGRAVANLACNAVAGLTPADVIVVSTTRGEVWNGG